MVILGGGAFSYERGTPVTQVQGADDSAGGDGVHRHSIKHTTCPRLLTTRPRLLTNADIMSRIADDTSRIAD